MIRAPVGSPAALIDIVNQVNTAFVNLSLLPVKMPSYPKANLPDPATFRNCWIKVPDEAGGDTAAESDGTHWRRMQDRAIVS